MLLTRLGRRKGIGGAKGANIGLGVRIGAASTTRGAVGLERFKSCEGAKRSKLQAAGQEIPVDTKGCKSLQIPNLIWNKPCQFVFL